MKFNLSAEELERVHDIQDHVEDYSKTIDAIVNDIIQPYCKDLDNYVGFIKDCLKDGENPPTSDELDAIEKDIKKHLRKDARYALNLVEKYGYRLQDLLETVQKFGDSVSKSQASDMPMWKNHEIINGSADGKRVGLKRIMGQMVSACKKMEKSIRTLAVKQKSAYEEICDKNY